MKSRADTFRASEYQGLAVVALLSMDDVNGRLAASREEVLLSIKVLRRGLAIASIAAAVVPGAAFAHARTAQTTAKTHVFAPLTRCYQGGGFQDRCYWN